MRLSRALRRKKRGSFQENIMPVTHTKRVVEREGRERILREAHALFLATGFAEVSMQQIADAVGMTKAAMYYHFRDKQDLFAHVVAREAKRLVLGMRAELAGVQSFRDQLLRLAPFAFYAFQSDISRLMTDFKRHVMADVHWRNHEAWQGGELNPIATLRPYFEQAIARGEMRELDVEVAILAFLGMIEGICKFAEQGRGAIALSERHVETLVDLFLHGVGGRSA